MKEEPEILDIDNLGVLVSDDSQDLCSNCKYELNCTQETAYGCCRYSDGRYLTDEEENKFKCNI